MPPRPLRPMQKRRGSSLAVALIRRQHEQRIGNALRASLKSTPCLATLTASLSLSQSNLTRDRVVKYG